MSINRPHLGESVADLKAQLAALMDAFNDQAGENERLTKERDAERRWKREFRHKLVEAEATIERLRAALGRANAHVIDAMATIGQQEATIEELKEALLEWFFDPDNVPVLAARLAREHNAALTGKEQE